MPDKRFHRGWFTGFGPECMERAAGLRARAMERAFFDHRLIEDTLSIPAVHGGSSGTCLKQINSASTGAACGRTDDEAMGGDGRRSAAMAACLNTPYHRLTRGDIASITDGLVPALQCRGLTGRRTPWRRYAKR